MVKCKSCETKCRCGEKISVSFCPKCKSFDVKYTFGFGNLFGVIPKMRCGHCGFTAIGFPILVMDKKKIKKLEEKMMGDNKSLVKRKKYCPKCGGNDVCVPMEARWGKNWMCKSCGYISESFPEKGIKSFRRKRK